MDNNSYKDMANSKIASFDHIYSTDHIRMLKIFLHYIPKALRKNLSVYIKFMELQHALSCPQHFPERNSDSFSASETVTAENSLDDHLQGGTAKSAGVPFSGASGTYSNDTLAFTTLIHELLPFCNPREKQQFQNMENMMNSFEQMKNVMEMMEMMKDMKDMFGDSDGGFTPDMLAGMMGMDGVDFGSMFGK